MARNGTIAKWDALSPKYKARLERNGYTLEDYLSGQSRTAARGHAKTPEHPSRSTPERYPEYESKHRGAIRGGITISHGRRQSLVDKIEDTVRADRSLKRYDIDEIQQNIMSMHPTTFIRAEVIPWDEWRLLGSIGANRYNHGESQRILAEWDMAYWDSDREAWINPFWYH